jgi:N,N'-diacetyllegionaminate synthase
MVVLQPGNNIFDKWRNNMKRKLMRIGNRNVGDGESVFIIAEVGINHNGSLSNAKRLITAANDAGADAVKLQSYITEKRVPTNSPIFENLKNCELSFDEQEELFSFASELNILLFSTPFDDESVDFLETMKNPVYKVASFDSVNKSLLRKIGATKKPVIMSTGMTSSAELSLAKECLLDGNIDADCNLAFLHCVSSYPTPPELSNLSIIHFLRDLHQGPIGYSDHTIGINIPISAVAAGAKIIEKHFTTDNNIPGADHSMSANPNVFRSMVEGIRNMETILGGSEMRIREVERGIEQFRRPSS